MNSLFKNYGGENTSGEKTLVENTKHGKMVEKILSADNHRGKERGGKYPSPDLLVSPSYVNKSSKHVNIFMKEYVVYITEI